MLRPLEYLFRAEDHPDVLVGLGQADDAAVYRLDDERVLIFTTDFFTPVLDDAYTYGAVAASNSMSDVYAMGGEVTIALNIAAFPDCLPRETLTEILRGGAHKVAEAGGVVVGGHTINDDEPKYGLAVIGIARPNELITKDSARPGDQLVLTKRLGTGVITTALKRQVAEGRHVEGAVRSMLQLNRRASQLARRVGVRAGTDVTGFSLIGHALELARRSSVRIRIRHERVAFLDGSLEYGETGVFPGGTRNNAVYFGPSIQFPPDLPEFMRNLLLTPETSGGLLLAVAPDRLDALLKDCESEGQDAWVVGEVSAGSDLEVT